MLFLERGVAFTDNTSATYGIDSDFPPYSYIVDGTPRGFESNLIKLIINIWKIINWELLNGTIVKSS